MKMIRSFIKDHKGLSLVELIVTVAIMALVSAGIATAVVSATRNYSRGNSEVDLQQEVQVITNILNNIVIDSIDATNPSDTSILNITASNGDYYVIKCDGSSLSYTKTSVSGGTSGTETLSTYVTSFSADASKYNTDRTVVFNLGFLTTQNQREMKTTFTATSRNAETKDTAIQKFYSATIIAETLAVVEPNQTIEIPFDVLVSGDADTTISYVCSAISSDSTISVDTDFSNEDKKIVFHAGPGEAHEKITVTLRAVGNKDGAEVYNSTLDIFIMVRRVNRPFELEGKAVNPYNSTGAGAQHQLKIKYDSNASFFNPDRYFALSTDADYVSPYNIKYVVESTVGYNAGNVVFSSDEGSGTGELIANVDDTVTVTLNSAMRRGNKIIIRAYACHAGYVDGTADNKTGISYDLIYGEYVIEVGLFPSSSGFKRGQKEGEPAKMTIDDLKLDTVLENYLQSYYLPELRSKYSTNSGVLNYLSDGNNINAIRTAFKNGNTHTAVFYSIGSKEIPDDPMKGSNYYKLDSDGFYWSQYRLLSDGIDSPSISFDEAKSKRLEPDKEYRLEYICVLYVDEGSGVSIKANDFTLDSISSKKILWPKYDKLSELGFNAAGFTFDDDAEAATEEYSTYGVIYPIAPAEVIFNINIDGEEQRSGNIGSLNYPVYIGDKNVSFNYDQAEWTGLQYQEYQNSIGADIQVYLGDEWKTIQKISMLNTGDMPKEYTSNLAWLKFVINNTSYEVWGTNVNQTVEYNPNLTFRLNTNISMYLNYIKDGDGVFSKTIYTDTALKTHIYSNNSGCIYFKKYGSATLIALDANGGSVTPDSFSVVLGKTIPNLPVATRDGYVFSGWYTSKSGGKRITAGRSSTSLGDNRTLYAHWVKEGEREVYLDAQGGTVSPTSVVLKKNQNISGLPDPTLSGRKFNGWYTSGGTKISNNDAFSKLGDEDILYARWKYVVTLNANGGSSSVSELLIDKPDEQLSGLPGSATKTGETFLGWFTSQTGGTRVYNYNTYSSLGGKTTLYAHWRPNNIGLDPNGGSVGQTSISFNSGDGKIYNLPTPTRDGYGFIGWYTSATGGTKIDDGSTWDDFGGARTLYAHWVAPQYSVSITNNGTTERWGTYKTKYTIVINNTGQMNVNKININVSDGTSFHSSDGIGNPSVNGTVWTFTPYNVITPGGSLTFYVYLNSGSISG